MTTAFYNTYSDDETTVTPGENLVSPQDRSISIRTGGAVSYSGGEAQTINAYSSFNTASLDPSQGLQARTKTGSPRQGELQMSDIVKVPGGGETTLQNAVSLGLVERDQSGRWVAVPDGAAKIIAESAPQEVPQDEGEAFSNPAVETALADICSTVSGTTQVSVLQQLVNNGEIHQNTLNRAASESGIAPSELSQRLDGVVQGFQHQAETVLKGMGADDPSQFWEWAQATHKDDLKRAMTAHAMERTTKGYAPLFQTYIETLDSHSPEDILSAEFGSGIKAQKIDGKIVLDIPAYGRMTYRSAIKSGLITVRGI
jgi:hypothetical protein